MITAVESSAGAPAPRWQRWLAHLASTPLTLRRAFGAETLRRIGAAIELAEGGHTGEIVFVAEGTLPWRILRRNAAVRERALELFGTLRVWDTAHNNGILVYVGLADRAVEIVADRGIAAKVDETVWQDLCRNLREHCSQGRYEQGSLQAIEAIGKLLEQHFPLAPGQLRHNELPDRPLAL